MENCDKKELAQKSYKGQPESQKQLSSKNGSEQKKAKVSRAKNISSQSGLFFTLKTGKAFTKLKQAFVEVSILNHFDPQHHIQIEKNVFGYFIDRILSQLTSNNLGQWYPITFFSRKMISAKTWYKTYNGEPLAIVELFKTWRHYLNGYKNKVLILINHNNL